MKRVPRVESVPVLSGGASPLALDASMLISYLERRKKEAEVKLARFINGQEMSWAQKRRYETILAAWTEVNTILKYVKGLV